MKPAPPEEITMKTAVLVIAASGCSLANAQSLNIDLGRDAGIPQSSYAGAALTGLWNDGFGPDAENLRNLAGETSGASIGGTLPTFTLYLDDPGTVGDEAALLDDAASGFGDVMLFLTVNGLEPGVYDVYAYGFAGGQPNQRTGFEVENAWGLTGGAYSGALVEGVTHVCLTTRVGLDQSLSVGIVGGIWGQSGFFNGLQLVFDPCLADSNRDGVLDFFDVQVFLSRFAAHDWRADLNFDGTLDFPDVQLFLTLFSSGCP